MGGSVAGGGSGWSRGGYGGGYNYGGGSSGGGGGGGISNRGINNIIDVASTVNSTAGPYLGWGGVIGTAAERSLRASSTVDAATDVLKGVKVVGKGLGWAGAGLSVGVNIYNMLQRGNPSDIVRTLVNVGIVGVSFIGPWGPFVSFGLSAIEASGGFDYFYEWIDIKFGFP